MSGTDRIQPTMILRTLGRSGLLVSPISLGTMTFGNTRWGSPDDVSESIFKTYLEAGGNFIDTADVYAGGASETLLGRLIAEGNLRHKVVLATKSTFSAEPGNPLAGGNGRKHLQRSVERSLERLRTDHIDLYWMHAWDQITPVEEVLESLGNLVRAGKILYFGLSDCPAWYATRMATLAQAHAVSGPVALQIEYSLTERSLEYEMAPAARECGLGITPWSPLAAGFLTGKYSRDAEGKATVGGGRLDLSAQPFRKFTEQNWKILEAVKSVAAECGRSMAQVALAWASAQPGVTSLILGATKVEQLRDNLASLDLALSAAQLTQLNQASAPPPNFYAFFSGKPGGYFFAGATVEKTFA